MALWTEALPDTIGKPAGRGYIICATPRSGTTMLCGMLAECGAGWPASYYRTRSMRGRAETLGIPWRDGPEFCRDYLQAIRRVGSAGTDIFGMRLMQENADDMIRVLQQLYPQADGDMAVLQAAFGPLTFVHQSRRDKAAQAASLRKAHRDGLWHIGANGEDIERTEPRNAPDEPLQSMNDYVAQLEAEDAAWITWFGKHGITPVRVVYEDLAADPNGILRLVLSGIGFDPALADGVRPATAKLPG